ncbi:universal stress protein [Falsiroseomonas oryziterrae]|uniref:universal stress protein n=1 Tax=Falsiroseomonas oryziterrae TaxID=2911368 RepID=UPI001F3D8CF3|nr:universal stress protein [Roseomonas sp. NPKOSM-4]
MITTITTHVQPGTPAEVESRLSPALTAAEAFGAHLVTLVFAIDGNEELAGAAANQADELAKRRGIRGEVRPRSSFAYGAGEVFADHARVSDLAVVSLDLGRGLAGRMLLSAVAFGSGRPVLMVPEAAGMTRLPRRVLVGWDASPAAARAVAGALPFIRRAEETLVVTISDDKSLRSGQSGIELTHLLARHGAKASFMAVRADGRGPMAALSECAREREADLLVLGVVQHSPLHELVFGSATAALFQDTAGLPCLVAA